jgi:hypothetical protein
VEVFIENPGAENAYFGSNPLALDFVIKLHLMEELMVERQDERYQER